MIQFSENFEVESRRIEFWYPVDVSWLELTAKDLEPEPIMTFNLDLKSSHTIVREGLPF